MTTIAPADDMLSELPLDPWHRARGARMVPFAAYLMPLQFAGIVAEHEWTRSKCSLFDVSHMGQLLVEGVEAEQALTRILPANLSALLPGRMRYSLLLDESGGILDDLLVTRLPDYGRTSRFLLVVNGATKHDDLLWLEGHLPANVGLTHLEGRALFALQGPLSSQALEAVLPGVTQDLAFMHSVTVTWHGHDLSVGRSGYTGEDGFEISLPAEAAITFADALLADDVVKPAGLGARDSLRLEAGLPLYGHDIDRGTDPISAGLGFAISKRRREAGDFPGARQISRILAQGPERKRVGLLIDGRLPAREGAEIFSEDDPARSIGRVTSGGFSPTLGHPIAMGYCATAFATPGTALSIEVRGKRLAAEVVPLPFVPHRYHRQGGAK